MADSARITLELFRRLQVASTPNVRKKMSIEEKLQLCEHYAKNARADRKNDRRKGGLLPADPAELEKITVFC